MIAVITNGEYQTEAVVRQAARICEELEKRGETAESVVNNRPVLFERGTALPYNKAVFLDKDIVFARMLEAAGVRVYNSAAAVETADNKALTYICLRDLDCVHMPATVFAPKRYKTADEDGCIAEAERIIKYPLVIKENTGSLGEQVYLAENRGDVKRVTAAIAGKDHLYQEFIRESEGRSLRFYVAGGKVSAALRFVNERHFLSNVHRGGRAETADITEAHRTAAIAAAEKMKLDFCAVDFFDTPEPLLIEVNSNAFFGAAEKLGFNVAAGIAEAVVG